MKYSNTIVFNQIDNSLQSNTDFHISPILKQAFANCFYEST